MKRLLIPLLIGAVFASHAEATSIGRQGCAEASVVGHIASQTFEPIAHDDPNVIVTDGIIHIDFDVREVRFGQVKKGPIKVSGVAHTFFNNGVVHALYLHRSKDGDWWLADCVKP